MRTIRRIFLAGLIVLLPALITIYILGVTFNIIDSLLRGLLEFYLGYSIPGIGFIATILLIFLVGLLATNVFGKRILQAAEMLFVRLPVVKPVYSAARQIIDTFSAQRKNIFQSVAMIEYPRKGLYAIGFITGTAIGEVQHKTSQNVVTLFLPTTPNPTSGFLLLVPESDIIPLEMSVEEALKLIISGGVVSPDWKNGTKHEGEHYGEIC